MKTLLILLLCPTLCFSQIDDVDKHFVAGMLISTASTFVLKAIGVKYAPAWGFVSASIAGIGKEIIDHRKHKMRFKDENNDVYYDHIGDAFYTGSGGMTATITLFIILKKREVKDDYMYPVQ